MSIIPATMKISLSFPKVIGPDRISVEVAATTTNGEPLSGVIFDIYVDNVRKVTVRTDENGKTTLTLSFGYGDMGSHMITAKAVVDNYLPAESTEGVTIIPPLWLVGILVAIVVGAIAFRVVKGRRGSERIGRWEPTITCAGCGAELPADSSFCLKCGTSVSRND